MRRLSPPRLLALGYAAMMLAGFALLSLPLSTAMPARAIDHLFIAVSAVSTTGLASLDIGTAYTGFGQAVILVLIQVGGIGFMTVSSAVFSALGEGPPSRYQDEVTRVAFSLPRTVSPRRFVGRVIAYTAAVEALGTVLLAALFAARGVERPLWQGLFHAVSAFCTAGFSLFPTSLERFVGDAPVLLAVSGLAIAGATGFLVASEAWDRLGGRLGRMSLSTKLILVVSGGQLVAGTALLAAVEPSIAGMAQGGRLLNAFFQAMTASTTVGFNAVPTAPLAAPAAVATALLMVVGASPSGTGGGLKSTTVALNWGFLAAELRGRREVTLFGAAVPEARLRQALATLLMALSLLAAAMLALAVTERVGFGRLVFEAVSALSSAGLSLGVTAALTDAGKAVIMALMYVGRVGLLAFGVALAVRARAERVRAVQEDVAV